MYVLKPYSNCVRSYSHKQHAACVIVNISSHEFCRLVFSSVVEISGLCVVNGLEPCMGGGDANN